MNPITVRGDYFRTRLMAVAMFVCTGCSSDVTVEVVQENDAADVGQVVVYSTYGEDIVKPLFEAYTSATGVKIFLVTGDFQQLAEKVHKPGSDPVSDLVIAGNLADLWSAAEQGIFRPTRSDVIAERVPAQLRDPEHLWVSLGARARVVVYNTKLTSSAELESVNDYSSLTAETWRERLCLSSSHVPGNGSLIAMLINDHGIRDAEVIVRGWRANLATSSFSDDQDLLQAVAAGRCALAIADSSEIARFQETYPAAAVALHWFREAGVLHIDASGGGVTRHAQNPEGAASLLEWLTSASANSLFALSSREFPANARAETAGPIAAWSGFEANPVNLSNLGYLHEDAVKLAERARYP